MEYYSLINQKIKIKGNWEIIINKPIVSMPVKFMCLLNLFIQQN